MSSATGETLRGRAAIPSLGASRWPSTCTTRAGQCLTVSWTDWRSLLTRESVARAQASRLFSAGIAAYWQARVPLSSSFGRDWRVRPMPAVALDATERALLQNTAAALELRGTHARVDHVVAHVRSVKHADRKVLIFTSFTAQARVLAEAFRQTDDHPGAIALHTSDMAPADRDEEVIRFHYQPECRVMIADNSAAEGRNFQMVDELVFLDLPLSPNALEQRIGRVDRFNLRAKPGGTRCAYLTEEGSPWALGLQHFLRNVAGVFDKSVATLQRPLENLERRVRRSPADRRIRGVQHSGGRGRATDGRRAR